MRTPPLLLALLLLACGCGSEDPPAAPRATRIGKPDTPAGVVEAVVVERPAPDRAVIEARWRQPDGSGRLELVLPAGAGLVSGTAVVPLDPARRDGFVRWEVSFAPGGPLDAVVRMTADTASGPMSVESAVRLTD